MNWMEAFDLRQQTEIHFSRKYAAEYNHGTDGHNAKIIISTMADLLDKQEQEIAELKKEVAKWQTTR